MPTPELENDECDCGSCASIRERHFRSGLVWGAAIVGMFEAIRARYARTTSAACKHRWLLDGPRDECADCGAVRRWL